MSYPTQWNASNVVPTGTNLSAQGEVMHNAALFNSFPTNATIRQAPPTMHMQLNQTHPTHNSATFCPPNPAAYPFVYAPMMTNLTAQQNAAVQSRQNPAFCIPQPTQPNSAAAAAAAFRGTALLSNPANFQAVPPPASNQPQLAQMSYFPPMNGLQIAAAFPGAPTGPSFPHSSSLPQPHPGPFLATQFRGYDSLKHFGALPQATNHKRNKSMTTSKTNLYITGLSETDTDETVRALVENVVQPKSCKAMIQHGKCKGSGFIDCATEEDAVKALNHLTEMSKTGGRQLVVKYALENEKDLQNVYVRNLPRNGFTKELFLSLFRPYGQVVSVKLIENEGGFTGIGFVRFATAEQAQRAVDGMNEKKYVWTGSSDGNGSDSPNDNNAAKPISCKLADKADPRRRANGASMGTGTIAAGPSSSPSAGPLRGKFHNSRHHNQQQQTQTGQVSLQQQLICNDLHLHNHHQPMAAAISALSSKHQLPPGVIYPHSMISDNTGMMAVAAAAAAAAAGGYVPTVPVSNAPTCYSSASRVPPEAHDVSRSSVGVASVNNTVATTSVAGLLEIPSSQSPNVSVDQPQHLLPQPSSANGHASAAAVDSRYAAQFAAAAAMAGVASNSAAVMYPPSNTLVTGAQQYPRPTQQQPPLSLVQPTYSVATGHQHPSQPQPQQQNSYGHPNQVDLTAEQLQSLSLAAAARQSQQFYPDWQAAGFTTPTIPPGTYQTSTSGEAFVDGHTAAAVAALFNSYFPMQQSMQAPLHVQPVPMPQQQQQLISSQMIDSSEQQQLLQEAVRGEGKERVELSSGGNPTSYSKESKCENDCKDTKVGGDARASPVGIYESIQVDHEEAKTKKDKQR